MRNLALLYTWPPLPPLAAPLRAGDRHVRQNWQAPC